MLKSFYAENYRNLSINKKIEFSNLNILIGANGSGKSNFISSIIYLIDLFNLGFEGSIRKRGYRTITNRFRDNDIVKFEWVFNTENNFPSLKYKLDISIPNKDYIENSIINHEDLSYSKPLDGQTKPFNFISCHDREKGKCSFSIKRGGSRSNIFIDASLKESIFNQLDQLLKKQNFAQNIYPIFHGTVDSTRDYINLWQHYSMSNISTYSLKEYSELRGEEYYVNEKGDNFANVLRVVFSKNYSYRLELTKELKKYIDIDEINYELIGNRDVNIFVAINGKKFDINELSDGTVRLILLIFILTSPFKSKVLFIDEPELNLHPSWLKLISNLIVNVSSDTQIFLSTHSPEILDSLTESFQNRNSKVFVFNTNGNVKDLNPDSDLLKVQFNEGWQVGDLYRVGDPSLGGWPW